MTDLETLGLALCRILNAEAADNLPDPAIVSFATRLLRELAGIHAERGWQFSPRED